MMHSSVWLEPELDQPPPRPIRRRVGRAGFSLLDLVLVPFYIIGICLAYFAVRDLAVAVLIELAGQAVAGQVTDRQQFVGRKRTDYLAYYEFRVGDRRFADYRHVDAHAFGQLAPGTVVQVRICPLAPGLNSWLLLPGAESRWIDVGGLWLGGFIWSGILVFARWHDRVLPWRGRSLVRYGTPTIGTIIAKEEHRAALVVHYEYVARSVRRGRTDEKEMKGSMSVRMLDYMLTYPGDARTVLYNPRRPSRSIVYAFGDYEALLSS